MRIATRRGLVARWASSALAAELLSACPRRAGGRGLASVATSLSHAAIAAGTVTARFTAWLPLGATRPPFAGGSVAALRRRVAVIARIPPQWPLASRVDSRLGGLETFDRPLNGDRHLHEPFDLAEQISFVPRTERNRGSCRARAGGAANAVHVGFGSVRQVEIHNVRHIADIEAPRRNVGRHQHWRIAPLNCSSVRVRAPWLLLP